jgi:hypothetical protein
MEADSAGWWVVGWERASEPGEGLVVLAAGPVSMAGPVSESC